MTYPITTLTVSLLSLWLLVLAIRVIASRRDMAGEDGLKLFERRDRALGNMIEYVPIALILMFLLESQGASTSLTSFAAVLLVFGRLIHGIAFSFTSHWPFGRVGGTLCTYLSIGCMALGGLWMVISG